jgi:hypothetical protein
LNLLFLEFLTILYFKHLYENLFYLYEKSKIYSWFHTQYLIIFIFILIFIDLIIELLIFFFFFLDYNYFLKLIKNLDIGQSNIIIIFYKFQKEKNL